MARRGRSEDQLTELVARLEGVENELKSVRREAAELRAAHDDAIDLALIGAVPNTVFSLIMDARANGWNVTFRRKPRREGCGTVDLEHPDGPAHSCSIDLPLPEDSREQRQIETHLRMRIGWADAA